MTFAGDEDFRLAVVVDRRRRARRGAYFHPWHNWFLSAAHTDADIDEALDRDRRGVRRRRRRDLRDLTPGAGTFAAQREQGEVAGMDDVTKPSRFYDVETGGPIQLQLQQEGADFRVLRRFGYRDPKHAEAFVVPDDVQTFRTDLASIPPLFSWLVPGLGTHLPAVLLHDGLITNVGQSPTHTGPEVSREEADRILRDAMASLGTPQIRRWLMWAGVVLATCWSTLTPRWRWKAVVAGTVGIVVALGVLATLDLIDVWDVLPWMGARPWWFEVVSGVVFAVVVPLAVSVAWWRLWPAGAITGVALAFLLHVTAILFTLYAVYWLAETSISRREGTGPNISKTLEAAAPDSRK